MYSVDRAPRSKAPFFAGLFLLIAIGAGAASYFFVFNKPDANSNVASQSSSDTRSNTTSSGGTVAVLGQTQSNQQPQQTNTTEEPVPATNATTEPFSLSLPAGWQAATPVSEPDVCGGTKDWRTITYTNGSKTIVVYENGNPNGCSGTAIADVQLDYDFSADNSGITINGTSPYSFCTKEQNPACPKGDGVVSVFVANKIDDSAPTSLVPHPTNGNSYFFSATDTKIQSDLNKQVADMLAVIQAITFN